MDTHFNAMQPRVGGSRDHLQPTPPAMDQGPLDTMR
jgi:hypothetical protein